MRILPTATLASLALLPLAAHAEVPSVVTDIPPVASLVAQVMGDLGQPELLLSHGADPHHYQLRPSQARALQGADLLVWIGPEMTPWLERAVEGAGLKGKSLALLHAEGTMQRDYIEGGEEHEEGEAEEGHDHDHAAEGHDHAEAAHDHAEEAGHGHDHAHEGLNPHAWLDPQNARSWVRTIAAELSQLDPEHAATYAANAEATDAKLVALDAQLAQELAPVAGRPFMVFHDAYGYLAARYNLTVAGALAMGDAADPGAARIQALHKELADHGAVCVFAEAGHDPKLMQQLVEGTGAKFGETLDPEGTDLEMAPELYQAMMTNIGSALVDCLK